MSATTALVGYDGSPEADHAIACAARLLPQLEATVVTVWHPVWPSGDELQELLHEREGVTIDDLAARLQEVGEARATGDAQTGAERAAAAGWTARAVTRQSRQGVWFELAALARELGARVIVVGARGAGGATGIGRVADAVVRVADRPVVVVPDGAPDAAPDAPLVVGFDGSPLAAEAIRQAAALFPGRRAIVAHVGHLDLAQAGAELAMAAGLQAEARTAGAPVSDVLRPESAPWRALSHVADEAGAAAIVVGARGSGAVRRFLLGSTTNGLLHHARHALLVVPQASLESDA